MIQDEWNKQTSVSEAKTELSTDLDIVVRRCLTAFVQLLLFQGCLNEILPASVVAETMRLK